MVPHLPLRHNDRVLAPLCNCLLSIIGFFCSWVSGCADLSPACPFDCWVVFLLLCSLDVWVFSPVCSLDGCLLSPVRPFDGWVVFLPLRPFDGWFVFFPVRLFDGWLLFLSVCIFDGWVFSPLCLVDGCVFSPICPFDAWDSSWVCCWDDLSCLVCGWTLPSLLCLVDGCVFSPVCPFDGWDSSRVCPLCCWDDLSCLVCGWTLPSTLVSRSVRSPTCTYRVLRVKNWRCRLYVSHTIKEVTFKWCQDAWMWGQILLSFFGPCRNNLPLIKEQRHNLTVNFLGRVSLYVSYNVCITT